MDNKEAVKLAVKVTMWVAVPVIWLVTPALFGYFLDSAFGFLVGILLSTFICCFILAKIGDEDIVDFLRGKK